MTGALKNRRQHCPLGIGRFPSSRSVIVSILKAKAALFCSLPLVLEGEDDSSASLQILGVQKASPDVLEEGRRAEDNHPAC
jgi:hypothetical protein